MRKNIYALLIAVICISLCACSSAQTPENLSEDEAVEALKDVAEENLALALGVPSYKADDFTMDRYEITQASHNDSEGYWYFEIEGGISIHNFIKHGLSGDLAEISYSFDAKVNDQTGSVKLGELKLTKYPFAG